MTEHLRNPPVEVMPGTLQIDLSDCTECAGMPVFHKDFTLALPVGEWNRRTMLGGEAEPRFRLGSLQQDPHSNARSPARFSLDEPVDLIVKTAAHSGGPTTTPVTCRINACLCDGGKRVSVTARAKGGKFTRRGSATTQCSAFSAESANYILATEPVVNLLLKYLWGDQPRPLQGLIVVAGGTGSGKTDLAQPLALQHILALRSPGERPPHLVTYEDPIEKWTIYPTDRTRPEVVLTAEAAMDWQFNFTPREKGKDVASLPRAVADAKRQTPSCFYIGEVRSREDWQSVAEFAGSGHLVIATTHAGSLVETIGRILIGVEANTPAQRGWIARQLLCCVHMAGTGVRMTMEEERVAKEQHKAPPYEKVAKVGTIWFGSAGAINDLIVDGLAAVVPNNDSILSRRQLAHRVLSAAPSGAEEEMSRRAILAATEQLDLRDL
jgi:hypothetical protein